MKVLVIGKNGQLGWELVRRARTAGIPADGVGSAELDLTREAAVRQMVSRGRYAAVINAAAYTAVDRAESDADAAFAVNRDGSAHVADACRDGDIPLVHISTDYVFDGTGRRPYRVDDPIAPLGVYGQSKAAGEAQVRRRLDRHIIVRTSWLYGLHGNNFVKTILRLAREKKEIRVIDDQKGCPTSAADLAEAVIGIARRMTDDRGLPWGTYHYCNAGVTSWYRLADKAVALAARHETFTVERIVPIPTAEYPTPAPRPAYSALDCSAIKSAFGIDQHPWQASLETMIEELYSNG